MEKNLFDDQKRYLLPGYPHSKPFSSFLPGIAGQMGIPMWVFYVNRGQAISSFGTAGKDHPILEFQPANKAYQLTPLLGFRTFIQREGEEIYEPFASPTAKPSMCVGLNEVELEDSAAFGLQTNVLYFTLSQEPFAALVRQVTLTNTASTQVRVQVLDGLPGIVPYGVNNHLLKELGRTIEAWMQVETLANVAFYRLRASVADRPEVEQVDAGNFALGFLRQGNQQTLLSPVVDPALVFGTETSLRYPLGFAQQGLEKTLAAPQITTGRTPCAFWGADLSLAPGESAQIVSIYGHSANQTALMEQVQRIYAQDYLEKQLALSRQMAADLTHPIETKSALPVWDAYTRQTFLDNILRGGMPVQLGTEQRKHTYHIYSRKHGDLERDYNQFYLAPEFFSQGNGSYRDVNQNRRSDVYFYPDVHDHNIRTFLSLIQLDGYNPLQLSGSKFNLAPEKAAALAKVYTLAPGAVQVLQRAFSPGELLHSLLARGISAETGLEILNAVLAESDAEISAAFQEGYWVDHWTYNLDLLDSFLAIYPEQKENLFFNTDLPIYESAAYVLPSHLRFVETPQGPRQFHAIAEDKEKAVKLAERKEKTNWVRTQTGKIATTSVFTRLYMLAWLKCATLDPSGMGVEMEAGRPGWYDALNGLPALLGSSMPETYELLRLVHLLHKTLSDSQVPGIEAPLEFTQLTSALEPVLQEALAHQQDPKSQPNRWSRAAAVRDTYRQQIHTGLHGQSQRISRAELLRSLDLLEQILQLGLNRAAGFSQGVPVTYFTHTITAYEKTAQVDSKGRPYIQPVGFKAEPLPLFLEGPVHSLKTSPNASASQALHQAVATSPLFDEKLRMYKVNTSLANQPQEIGRARAFPSGWLENESIWLHMEYKYLLELLRAGLYAEFFEAMQQTMPPFLDPARYGRSPLENSSFIASSAHPDPNLHGAGFVARLSGSTAEFLSIWFTMMTGGLPFTWSAKTGLGFELKPILPGWMFDAQNQLGFRLLGHTWVTYHNPSRQNTWEQRTHRIELISHAGKSLTLEGGTLNAAYASRVRSGQVARIHMHLIA